jgi:hypothetical protein
MRPPVIVAIAGACAVAALSACGSNAGAHTAAPEATPTASRAVVLVNCPLEYASWIRGPARQFVPAIEAVDSSAAASSITARAAALKTAGSAVRAAAKYPIPACADPRGYWVAVVMHVNAAEASPNGAGSTAVMTALKGVQGLTRELEAELKRTAGVG